MRISDWSSDVCSSDLVERLGDTDEACTPGIQHLDDLGKVGQAPGQPVDLVDDDHIDPSRLHLGEELLQPRAIHIAARIAAIIVIVRKQHPAFVPLAQDIDGAGRSEEHTSELQSLMRISYAVFCLKKKKE